MTDHPLSDSDLSTLANICQTAAERFAEHASVFRTMVGQPAPQDGAVCRIFGEQARRLAEQFEQQEQEARDLGTKFAFASGGSLDLDPDDLSEVA